MLKMKLQYFDHLIWSADSLEKTMMLGKIEDRRRRGRQRMRWLDGITDSMDWVWARSGRWQRTGKPGMLQSMWVAKSWTQLSHWTTTQCPLGTPETLVLPLGPYSGSGPKNCLALQGTSGPDAFFRVHSNWVITSLAWVLNIVYFIPVEYVSKAHSPGSHSRGSRESMMDGMVVREFYLSYHWGEKPWQESNWYKPQLCHPLQQPKGGEFLSELKAQASQTNDRIVMLMTALNRCVP